MHPQIIFHLSGELHRENLARAERWRLARSAGTRSGRSHLGSPLARLASWASAVAGWRAGWAAIAQPAPCRPALLAASGNPARASDEVLSSRRFFLLNPEHEKGITDEHA